MDTAWIQVFILTVSECVAPAGKTVCQEQQMQMQFVDQAECELALEQLVTLKESASDVIVYKDRSRCVSSARATPVFRSLSEVKQSLATDDDWQAPDLSDRPDDFTKTAHSERLASLSACEDTGGVPPCKIGDIIIEGATSPKSVEVWRRDK
jgi:hypothetical protein